jgi:hypothetical protein
MLVGGIVESGVLSRGLLCKARPPPSSICLQQSFDVIHAARCFKHQLLGESLAVGVFGPNAGRRPFSQSPVSDHMITLGSSKHVPVQSGNGAEVAPAKEDPVILGSWATVQFCLKFKTNFGQGIRLLGSHPKLGKGLLFRRRESSQIAFWPPCY